MLTEILQQNKPLVSICCIAYNQSAYIREVLDGFLMQETDFSFEVLIHDDASTDKTADIIHEYEVKYPHIIKPIFQTENQYSKGVEILSAYVFPRAEGKYIALCEGDDYWIDKKKLQKQADFLEKNDNYGLVCTNYNIQHQNKKTVFKRDYKYQHEKDVVNINDIYTIATLTVLIRKKLLFDHIAELSGTINFIPKSATDFPIWIWFIKRSRVRYLQDITSVYRICEISATNFNTDGHRALQYCLDCEKTIFRLQKLNLLSKKESKYILLGLESKRWLGYFYTKSYRKLLISFIYLFVNFRFNESLNIIKMITKRNLKIK